MTKPVLKILRGKKGSLLGHNKRKQELRKNPIITFIRYYILWKFLRMIDG